MSAKQRLLRIGVVLTMVAGVALTATSAQAATATFSNPLNSWSGVPAQWTGANPSIYIVALSNPWTVTGARTQISTPTYEWEKQGAPMNEGPAALQRNGRTFITYSASACQGPDYKLGLLTLTGSNPLSAASWTKSPNPVFQRHDANGVYGPGHNGFFRSPDGTEDWIVYHANSSPTQACGTTRTTRVQKFTWNPDGTPNFGVPVSTSAVLTVPAGEPAINRIQSYNYQDRYIRHANFDVRLDANVNPAEDAQFRLVPGLANNSGYGTR